MSKPEDHDNIHYCPGCEAVHMQFTTPDGKIAVSFPWTVFMSLVSSLISDREVMRENSDAEHKGLH